MHQKREISLFSEPEMQTEKVTPDAEPQLALGSGVHSNSRRGPEPSWAEPSAASALTLAATLWRSAEWQAGNTELRSRRAWENP